MLLPTSPSGVLGLYFAAFTSMLVAVELRAELSEPVRPIDRGEARGSVEPGVPWLDPDDPMANAATLKRALAEAGDPDGDPRGCHAPARWFQVLLEGRQSRVDFSTRAVCQLKRLKEISTHQPGFQLAEMASFILGWRRGRHVTVTRVVVPPFHFTQDSIWFMPADLGPLEAGEEFIGTYHTHPDSDEDDGVPSTIDLSFMLHGSADFHGRVGRLADSRSGVDWLFDIVETRDGDWNVYAHDRARISELASLCEREVYCPVDEMRLAGSRYYLLSRYYTQPIE
jgi:proteasome lid subunit RPN8/RPN11